MQQALAKWELYVNLGVWWISYCYRFATSELHLYQHSMSQTKLLWCGGSRSINRRGTENFSRANNRKGFQSWKIRVYYVSSTLLQSSSNRNTWTAVDFVWQFVLLCCISCLCTHLPLAGAKVSIFLVIVLSFCICLFVCSVPPVLSILYLVIYCCRQSSLFCLCVRFACITEYGRTVRHAVPLYVT